MANEILAQDLSKVDRFTLANEGENLLRPVRSVYCGDLLSLVMGRAPAESAWVTVMGNINALAVAVLADVTCVILAEGMPLDEITKEKAKSKGVTLFTTDLPVYEAACRVGALLDD